MTEPIPPDPPPVERVAPEPIASSHVAQEADAPARPDGPEPAPDPASAVPDRLGSRRSRSRVGGRPGSTSSAGSGPSSAAGCSAPRSPPAAPAPAGSILTVAGALILGLGLLAAAGAQGIERRDRLDLAYRGPSPFLVFAAVGAAGHPRHRPHRPARPRPAGDDHDRRLGPPHRRDLGPAHRPDRGRDRRAPLDRDRAGDRRASVPAGSPRMSSFGALAAVPGDRGQRRSSAGVLVRVVGVRPESPLPARTAALPSLLLGLLAAVVIAPVGEEIFYRGFATTAWARASGPTVAIVKGALFFSIAHVLTISGQDFGQAAGSALVAFVERLPVGARARLGLPPPGLAAGLDRAPRDVQRDHRRWPPSPRPEGAARAVAPSAAFGVRGPVVPCRPGRPTPVDDRRSRRRPRHVAGEPAPARLGSFPGPDGGGDRRAPVVRARDARPIHPARSSLHGPSEPARRPGPRRRRWTGVGSAGRSDAAPRDPRAARHRAAARATRAAGRRRADDRRAHRPRLGIRGPRRERGRPRRRGARPSRRTDRARPGLRARARAIPGRRRGQGRPAHRRLRARSPAPCRLAVRALVHPLAGRRRRPAHPPDGPARTGGAAGRPPEREERRAAGRHRLPGQRLLEPGPGRGALPRRRPAERERDHPRPQPSVGRPDALARRPPPDRRGARCRSPPRRGPARPPRHRPRRLSSRCATVASPSTDPAGAHGREPRP